MREFNSATEYYVATPVEGELEPDFKELAAGILEVDPDIDDETEEFGYYDIEGGGTELAIGRIAHSYTVSGHRFVEDEAQNVIAALEWEQEGRVIPFRILDSDYTYEGEATVSNIKLRGGESNDYRPFECEIRWVRKPDRTPTV